MITRLLCCKKKLQWLGVKTHTCVQEKKLDIKRRKKQER